jgi:INO80 complex subunit C
LLPPPLISSTFETCDLQTLAEQLSYLHAPRPFKNPNYSKNANRRTKNLKAVLSAEKERERLERERVRSEKMEVDEDAERDGDATGKLDEEEDLPTCACGIVLLI